MTPKDQAREIVRTIIGQEVPVVMSRKDGVHYFGGHAPGTDIAVTLQMHPDGPLAHFTRFGMTSDPTDPETARAIFAALCHLGCA
jgi:allantoicase